VDKVRTALASVLVLVLAACGSDRSSDALKPSSGGATDAPPTAVKSLPFNASGLLAGTAVPNLPDGESGKVSVVQVGPLVEAGGSAKLPIAFRNNTGAGVSHIDWAGTARSGGSIVATGSSQGTIPAQVKPGEVGLAFIFFDGQSKLPPADAQYQFTVKTSPANQNGYNTAPLGVTEANLSGNAIVGAAVNRTGKSVEGPFAVSVYCFDGDKLLSQQGAFAEQQGPVAADGQVTFSADLYGANCPTFTVGVDGYFAE
jgi:hypothetical protein